MRSRNRLSLCVKDVGPARGNCDVSEGSAFSIRKSTGWLITLHYYWSTVQEHSWRYWSLGCAFEGHWSQPLLYNRGVPAWLVLTSSDICGSLPQSFPNCTNNRAQNGCRPQNQAHVVWRVKVCLCADSAHRALCLQDATAFPSLGQSVEW